MPPDERRGWGDVTCDFLGAWDCAVLSGYVSFETFKKKTLPASPRSHAMYTDRKRRHFSFI